MPRIMASVYDAVLRPTERACLARWRAELLADARGHVLEVGAGTGANLPFYPRAIQGLILAEPDAAMRAKLRRKIERGQRTGSLPVHLGTRLQLSDASLEQLPWPDASFDVIVCTFVLCSVPDPAQACREIYRVLAPAGRLLFIEHIAAAEGSQRLAWQRRVEPLWTRVAGNCHPTRHADAHLHAQGFVLERALHEPMRRVLPFLRPSVRGVALKPSIQ